MIPQPIREIHQIGEDTPELGCPPVAMAALAGKGMTFAGLSDAGRGYRMARPRPRSGHLLVCHGGVGRVRVDGEWAECAEGQAYVSPPRVPMAFETISGHRWKIAWVFFDADGVALPGALAADRSTLVQADPRPLANAIEGLYREGVGNAESRLLAHWASLVYAYALRIVLPPGALHPDPLWKLWAAVDARPAADWTVDRLAALAGLSGESLRKLCRRHVGRSPMRHVAYLRMRRADTLLRTTSAKLSVIAKTVGYDNVFAFSTAFTRCHGAPPSARRGSPVSGP